MVHESGTSGADGAREVHEITQWCTRLRSGTRVRVVHERCTRLRSGARDYVVVHEYEWCTRLRSGARDYVVVHEYEWMVHEITWQACPEWDEVSSELACRTSLTLHLDSTFLGVHLDSTSLPLG